VATQIHLSRENRGKALFCGQYAAFTQLEALDMSVLGRDVIELFAAIIDRPGNVVALIRQHHRYTVQVAQ
jgi:hypothetical protein